MKMAGYSRTHDLSPARQLASLRASPWRVQVATLTRHSLYIEIDVVPLPESRVYRLAITLRRGGVPDVRVLSPDLAALAGERELPHVYVHDHPVRLCLYLPMAGEWSTGMYISHTTVPWALEWLTQFEAWLFTDQWRGGGLHPGDPLAPRGRRRLRRNPSTQPKIFEPREVAHGPD